MQSSDHPPSPRPPTPRQALEEIRLTCPPGLKEQIALFSLMGVSDRIEFLLHQHMAMQQILGTFQQVVAQMDRRVRLLGHELALLKTSLSTGAANTAGEGGGDAPAKDA